MTQSAFSTSSGNFLDSYDFNQNYKYLKKLIQDLKVENGTSLRKEIFGEDECDRTLTKKQMKQLFRFLRKIEHHYEECCNPPFRKSSRNPFELVTVRNGCPGKWKLSRK